MRPFTEDDVGRFFGREIELDNIVDRLRQGEREVYLGPPGSNSLRVVIERPALPW